MSKWENFWKPLTPYSFKELETLENESYSETKLLYNKFPEKAEKTLNALLFNLDLRKIACDMYVWERIAAVKKGIMKAQLELIEVNP